LRATHPSLFCLSYRALPVHQRGPPRDPFTSFTSGLFGVLNRRENFMKVGLLDRAWESMRSPEEIRQDEDRDRHLDGYCEGAPYCWLCQEEKEQAEREDVTRRANQRAKELMEIMDVPRLRADAQDGTILTVNSSTKKGELPCQRKHRINLQPAGSL
jgi:hypothetical protein